MNADHVSRRQFLGQSAVAAGAIALGATVHAQTTAPAAAPLAAGAKRTASDIVPLGNTGLKVSRLGLGLGSNNGMVQLAAGNEAFNKFIKHAYDQGITLFDTAQAYRTFNTVGAAIKGLPRDKIFIQSKIGSPNNILDTIDNHRKTFGTDYIDSMLIHIQYRENWIETWKKAMDDFDAAKEKKWILSKGISCHSLPALRASITSDWTQVHLVRVNPQGIHIDSEAQASWGRGPFPVNPVVTELKKMKEKQRGVIGMKIYANGELNSDAEREKSLRYVMGLKEVDAIVVGYANIEQFDQGYKLLNTVLSESA